MNSWTHSLLPPRNSFTPRIIPALLVCALLTGCVLPVPVNYYARDSRKNIGTDDTQWLISGKTPRHEVLLRLGEPDAVTTDESLVTYRWKKIRLHTWIAAGGGYQAAVGRVDFGRDHALELTFDEHGTLTNRVVHRSKFKGQGGVSF